MNKKMFATMMACMMLVIIASAIMPVNAKTAPKINGTLVVHVYNFNQTVPDAVVTAHKVTSNSTYTIPFNNLTMDYRRNLPQGLYEVVVCYANQSQWQYANISVGQTFYLTFSFA